MAVAAAAAHKEQLLQYGKLQVKFQVQMVKEFITSHYAELAK